MSYNIDNVEVLSSTLRVSKRNAKKIAKLDLPEGFADQIENLTFGEDGFADLETFNWTGESSGNSENDGTLASVVALLKGKAELILTWEGGDSHSGLRIRDGKMFPCDVVMTLAPEE